MTMTEKQTQLVVAAQSGDVKSYEELYSAYHDKVYALARVTMRNPNDAQTVLQETFVTAWKRLNTIENPAVFAVWIQVIAKNLCNVRLQKKNLAILIDADQEIDAFDAEESDIMLPAAYADKPELVKRLGHIMDDLSEVHRQSIVFYYFNQLSIEEIADVMECSENTVKTRLFLARRAIRTEIEEEQKCGEDLYVAFGEAMLGFSELVYSQLETLSISQNEAAETLDTIINSLT